MSPSMNEVFYTMKKMISLILLGFLLSSCSIFRTHKLDIDQGNIISEDEVSRLHTGMTTADVKNVMGSPVLTNVFTPNKIIYIYTFQEGHGTRQDKRLILSFYRGRLENIERN